MPKRREGLHKGVSSIFSGVSLPKGKFFALKAGVSATKQKVMAILMPILFIVLIVVLIQVFGTGPHRTRAATKKAPGQTIVAADAEIDWQIPAPYPTTLRDPMQISSLMAAQAETPKIEELIVKGILYSKDSPAAFIGTQIVHEGDKISDATVVKIDRDAVFLEMNGKRWTLKVQQ